jgi:carotenoid 1,2-hydratase
MKIYSSIDEDVWHDLQTPGSYEWWYFDAVSEDEKYSFVAIWYSGFPFSPYYLKKYASWKENSSEPKPNPLEHAALSFSFYENGVETLNFIKEGDAHLFEASTKTPQARFECNEFFYDELHGRFVLRLDFEMPSRRKKVKAELYFTPKKFDNENLRALSSGDGEHAWVLVAPVCAVSGQFHITDGGDEQTVAFNGRGYHDHNFGQTPMDTDIENWYWGRAHAKNYDLIYYIISYKNPEREPFTFLYLTENHQTLLLKNKMRVDEQEPEKNIISPRYGKRIHLSGADAHFVAEHLVPLDTGPFYMRFQSRFVLNLEGGRGIVMNGISEFLHPERLTSGIVRNLIKSKIWRDGQSSVMYTLYNFFNRLME